MQKKKLIVMCSLLVAIVLLGIGTIAYFRRTVNGNITGNTGNLVLIVNEKNAVDNQTFTVSLNRSEEEPYVMPGDSNYFDLNVNSTGSSDDVELTVTISRNNLPNNLKFYLDEDYEKELTTRKWLIEKADTMTKTIRVYWYWDGSIDDENDTEFMNQAISANISVSATIYRSLAEKLVSSAVLDTNVDFSLESSSSNGQGLMLRSGTENTEYPVAYYRGDVTNNNAIFAEKCWLIVRTTETGGIKLIYNGEVNADGSCNNYSGVGGVEADTTVYPYINYKDGSREYISFNEKWDSPVYVGYMYNDDNTYFTHSSGWDSKYNWDDIAGTLDTSGYATHLQDNTIDTETGHHNQNKNSSTIKTYIDTWYESNIKNTSYENLLEDEVWCADRSITSTLLLLENYAYNAIDVLGWTKAFPFSAATRLWEPTLMPTLTVSPSLTCNRDMDKFTVDSAKGNGDLDYKIGLITADEAWLAGNISYNDANSITLVTTYLTVPTHYYWTMTPLGFTDGSARAFGVFYGELGSNRVFGDDVGLRPSVSLGLGALVHSGNGTQQAPYNFD